MSNLKSTHLIFATILLVLLINIDYRRAINSNGTASVAEEFVDGLEYLWMGSDEIARMLASSASNALESSKAVYRKCGSSNPSYCLPNQNNNRGRIYCGTGNRDQAC